MIPSGSVSALFDVMATTFMPIATAMRAVAIPVLPSPTIPIVLPASSVSALSQKQKSGQFVHLPSATSRAYEATWFVMLRMWAKAICATDMVL